MVQRPKGFWFRLSGRRRRRPVRAPDGDPVGRFSDPPRGPAGRVQGGYRRRRAEQSCRRRYSRAK
ncbi:glycine-rich protein 2 [Phtheirospermum japonicum]|uniref:Glycine-rich protein 2 n=1 Tax=Phtheirospermum japonicum TaxID=374723 RepID=A0A830BHX0_9LAMI|nr:glycine-rich protein 2 [Phtheirospermum japonicum]